MSLSSGFTTIFLQERASSSWRVCLWSVASRWAAPARFWRTAGAPRAACCGSGSPGTASLIWVPAPAWASTSRTRRDPWACSSATWPRLCCGGVAMATWCMERPSGRWLWPAVRWWWRRTFTMSGKDMTRREKVPVPTRMKVDPQRPEEISRKNLNSDPKGEQHS